jgi:hypothetical protein
MRDCANPDKQQLNSRPANATADLEGGEFFPSIAISLRDFEIHFGPVPYRGITGKQLQTASSTM